jgi:hypothetical protein
MAKFKFEVQHLLKTDVEMGIYESSFDGGKPFCKGGIEGNHINKAYIALRKLHFISESADL